MADRVGGGTHNADVDLVTRRERRVTGYGHRMLQGKILHYMQTPQLLADSFHSRALRMEMGRSIMLRHMETEQHHVWLKSTSFRSKTTSSYACSATGE